MTDKLMKMNLTPTEWKLVMFFFRSLQGYQMKEKVIKTGKIIEDTEVCKQRAISAINSLIDKKIIERDRWSGWERGEYAYRWNEAFFGRTHATREVRIDPKVIHIKKYQEERGNNIRTSRSQNPDFEVTESGPEGNNIRTSKTPRTAPSGPFGAPKDTLKDTNINLKERESDPDGFSQEDRDSIAAGEAKKEIHRILNTVMRGMK